MTSPADFSLSERLVLSSWFTGTNCDGACERPDVDAALDDCGFAAPAGFPYTRQQAAVAGVILDRYQHRLLHWREAPQLASSAFQRRRAAGRVLGQDGSLIRHLFTIRWGLGPGSSWANLYALIWLPEFCKFVVTDSTDDGASYEHSDFAIGHFGPCADENAAAMEVIGDHWRLRREGYADQEPVVLELQFGTIVGDSAQRWLRGAWDPSPEAPADAEALR